MRARLAASKRPDRIFEVTLAAAKRAGLVGRRRVLDSTPVYDAVATMDTVTLIRSAVRGLLRVADAELAAALQAVLERDDDYVVAGKPVCDYDDQPARPRRRAHRARAHRSAPRGPVVVLTPRLGCHAPTAARTPDQPVVADRLAVRPPIRHGPPALT